MQIKRCFFSQFLEKCLEEFLISWLLIKELQEETLLLLLCQPNRKEGTYLFDRKRESYSDSYNRILDGNSIGKEVLINLNLNPVINKTMMYLAASYGPSTVILHWRSQSNLHDCRSLDSHPLLIVVKQRKGVLNFFWEKLRGFLD